MKKRNRAWRRDVRNRQIIRKKRICHNYYDFDWYRTDGAYSKGKIHCSCFLCKPSKRWKMPTFHDAKKLYKMELDQREALGLNIRHNKIAREVRKASYYGAGIK